MLDHPTSDERLEFRFRFGTSILAEFAVSHTPADVLRELAQNEYDAGGTQLTIEFGADALVVRGNGTNIDDRGWKRLSVMLGTGHIAGETGSVQAKVNGIGSKNFGLRSLFLFGDRIYVASGGRRTILDQNEGTLERSLPDPVSAGTAGVVITVPYRQTAKAPLYPFDEARELEALKTITNELAPTLVKLVQPGHVKSLRSVVVRSHRLGHELRWRQTARADPAIPGLVKRNVQVVRVGESSTVGPSAISEVEHQVVLSPPKGVRKRDLPGYFRVSGGRVRLGISFRIKRGRLDLDTAGSLYYPLCATGSRTGFCFSICAPFETTEDRSNIIDRQNSSWNAWLLEEAARLAVRLLPHRLFATYGADAFIALDSREADTSTVPALSDEIHRLMDVETCWPSQAKRRGGRPVFASAKDVLIPGEPTLAEFITETFPPEEVLDERLAAHAPVRSLAAFHGAKAFTVSSLVHLRCTGTNPGQLATRLDPAIEAVRAYQEFPSALEDLSVQCRFAAAIDACKLSLKDPHKTDLRQTATTMTAAGTLAAPSTPLWVVDETLAGIAPTDRTLHPELARYRVMSGLCRPFKVSNWVIDASKRIMSGSASTSERDAVSAYLRGHPVLSEKAWTAVRRSPVLIDRRGEVVAPADMVISSAKGASVLASALHLPLHADEANESLKRLRFRTKVQGADLVAMARRVDEGYEPPTAMRKALARLSNLLTRSVLAELKTIRFLETPSGAVLTPVDTYVPSDQMIAILGDKAPYAIELPVRLLGRLGSRTEPTVDDVVGALSTLRDLGKSPSRPDLLYRALVEALRRERRAPEELSDQRILWTGSGWEAPVDCLVGRDNRKTFLDAVPVLSDGLRDTWIALGVSTTPVESHWRCLLEWIGARYGSHTPLPTRLVDIVRRAYRQLGEPPAGLPISTRCLLDEQGLLHAFSEAATGHFVINDHPSLALQAAAANAPVAFADTTDRRSIPFYVAANVKQLSEVAIRLGTECGPELEHDESLRGDATLKRLKAPSFASAVSALVSTISGPERAATPAGLEARLARIERITVVDGIDHGYRVGGTAVVVHADFLVLEDQIVVNRVPGSYELRRAVADAIAVVADDSPLAEQVLGDPIYFLLRCRSVTEIQRELRRRRIAWRPNGGVVETADDDELEEDESASLADAIARSVLRNALQSPVESTDVGGSPTTQPRATPPGPLPDIHQVHPRPAAKPQTPTERGARSGSRDGVPNAWTPHDVDDRDEDRALGRRGEEIVLLIERQRVARLGRSSDEVTWTADDAPFADHDIKSVDDDGEEIWIEVKSTTGRNGRFTWPGAEFRLAIRARSRYVLYRVYEADTTTPSWRCFRDPIGLFEAGSLRLDLDRLAGDVGHLTTSDDEGAPQTLDSS